MKVLPLSPRMPTRKRFALAGMVGLWGAAVAAVLFPDEGGSVVGMAACGAFGAGLFCGPFFGRQGWRGVIWMGAAGIGTTLAGAALGAGLLFGPNFSSFAALLVAVSIVTSPLGLLTWLCGLLAVRLGARAMLRA